jgi:hypothetical protein
MDKLRFGLLAIGIFVLLNVIIWGFTPIAGVAHLGIRDINELLTVGQLTFILIVISSIAIAYILDRYL